MLYSTSPELILHNWNFIHMLHQLLTSWKPPFHSSPGFCESAVLDTACKLHRVAFVLCDCYYTQPSLGTVLKEKEMPHNVTIWWTLRGWFLRVAPADNHGTSLKVWPEKRDVVLRTDLGAPQRQQRCWAGGRQTALSLSPCWSCQRWEERKGKKRMHVVLRGKSQVDGLGADTAQLCEYKLALVTLATGWQAKYSAWHFHLMKTTWTYYP